MIEEAHATSLIPHLISMLKGNEVPSVETVIPVVYHDFENDQDVVLPSEVESNSQYISVLSIKSTIFKYDQQCGPMGTRSMMRIMKEWESNDNIIGVVLDIDSGGGQADGTGEFAKFLNNYSKPVAVYSDAYICSAAYYLAAACKGGIILNEHASLTGSLGSMVKYVNLDGVVREAGGVVENIYSSGSPRKNEEVRAMEENNSKALFIKNIIDPHRNVFISEMQTYRPQIAEVAFDGPVFYPNEAISTGLADKIGTIQDAFDKVVEMHTASKSKRNSKTTNMSNSKQLPRVQAVLGLDAPLASTEAGSYLNSEQLDTVEAHIVQLENDATTATSALKQANEAHATAIQTATGTITTTEASVDSMLTASGLPVTGTLPEKITALDAHLKVMNAKDGDKHTIVKTDASNPANSSTTIGGIDVSAALNN